jgi:uncharacterized membrane protein (DUF485 family)
VVRDAQAGAERQAPEKQDESLNAETNRRNARYGLWLFAAYLSLYAGFMLLNVASPATMAAPFLLGINLAVVYGFGLILAAFAIALVYMAVCRFPVVGPGTPAGPPDKGGSPGKTEGTTEEPRS